MKNQGRLGLCMGLLFVFLAAGCGAVPQPSPSGHAHLPLLKGWFDDQEVFYVTTDVSDTEVARAKGANFAPLLRNALPTVAMRQAGARNATDKVYAVVNREQPNVFASAPEPLGASNRLTNYSPLWQLVKVTWRRPAEARMLRSEESVLAASDRGEVDIEPTGVVLNCPIVHRGTKGGLPGVLVDRE